MGDDVTDTADLYLAAGKLLMFSSGSYSDYHTMGCFVALEDLTRSRLQELAEATSSEWNAADAAHDAASDAWEAAGRPGDYPTGPGDVRQYFVAACIRAGLLLSVDYTELNIGDYSDLSLSL